ncbi:hypothetical protein ACIRRH_38845 [Kitasatospora sp. NPDC101235]|uniref:hypothetical protein n=1 Tax=Kitasatospora sp. NPDC101235 TaxID=3364101 RepID=UPI00381B7431
MRLSSVILPIHRWSEGQKIWRRAEELGFHAAYHRGLGLLRQGTQDLLPAVERVNGTLVFHRRLARDRDHRPDHAASRVHWAPTAGMLRRLAAVARL